MHRNRRPRRHSSARLFFSLPLLLALLSLVCLPALAHAEEEGSAGIEYEHEPVPTAGGKKNPIPQVPTVPQGESPATTSNAKGDGSEEAESESKTESPGSETESTEEEESKTGGSPVNGDGGNGPTGKEAKPAQGNGGNGQPKGEAGLSSNQKVASASSAPAAIRPEPSDSGGGSSPIVPILIAVAVLAAISIGVVVYRQRRQDPGSPVSPKAS